MSIPARAAREFPAFATLPPTPGADRLIESAGLLDRRRVAMPDLRIEPTMGVFARINLDFGYCNVLPGLRLGRPAVHYFLSGIPALDTEAARRLRLAGVDPVPVSTADVASALMLLEGGLHCCCGSI